MVDHRDAWLIRERWVYLHGQRIAKPDSFRSGRGRMYPTPGGRWRVRQTRAGRFHAYVEQGSSFRFRKTFATFNEAINYAQAMSYIARHFPAKGVNKLETVYARKQLQNVLYTGWAAHTRGDVDDLLYYSETNGED